MASLALASPAPLEAGRADYRPVLLAWLAVALGLAAMRWSALSARGPADPDSLMRLVEMRDFLAGAAWTDLRQPRLSPPDGIVMHWSRLIDAPLAGMVRLIEPFAGRAAAETAVTVIWPGLLFGPYLFGVAALSRRLIGADAILPAVAFGVFAAPALAMFMPGMIDHHNAQLALLALLMAAAVRVEERPVLAWVAGVLAAAMLAIGLETLPAVAVVGTGLALAWAIDPVRFAAGARGFGLAFAAGMILQRAAAAAPADWTATACDVASAPYVAAATVGGLGLAALTAAASHRGRGIRLGGLALIGAAAAAVLLAIAPACLSGPYAEIDPRIVPIWLARVGEARSIVDLLAGPPGEAARYFLGPAIALAASLLALSRAPAERRFGWALTTAALGVAILVAAWQVRGSTFAAVLAIPALAGLVLAARRHGEGRSPAVAALLLLAAYLVPNQYLHMAAQALPKLIEARRGEADGGTAAAAGGAEETGLAACYRRDLYAGLAAEPRGVVLAPSNLGSALLAHSPHGVVSAAYHRNAAGILDGFAAFGGSTEAARDVVLRRGVTLVVVCSEDDEAAIIAREAPEGFIAGLLAGRAPAWLAPLPEAGPLRAWRVIAPRAEAAPPLPLGELRGAL